MRYSTALASQLGLEGLWLIEPVALRGFMWHRTQNSLLSLTLYSLKGRLILTGQS
ncbi:MAG TPA: hypothetical protein V6D26_27760 [Stenomitos sp.]